MTLFSSAGEASLPMGLVTPPDRQGDDPMELVQRLLAIYGKDGMLDDYEMQSLNVLGNGIMQLQQARLARMAGQQQNPTTAPSGPPAGGDETQPYGQAPGSEPKPLGLTGGYGR